MNIRFCCHHWLIFRQYIRLTSWLNIRLCLNLPTQPFFQFRVSLAHRQIPYRIGEGLSLTYQHADFLGSRNARIDKKWVISTGITTMGYSEP